MLVTTGLVAVAVFLATVWLTGIVRRYALQHRLLDVPNVRSSHATPTPRGGGVAVAAVTLVALGGLMLLGHVFADLGTALMIGGLAIAAIGWVDDHRSVPAAARVLVHFAAASWAVVWLGGMPHLELGVARLPVGWLGHSLAVVAIVWCTNFYNFMDGIDGIAAGQAVTAGAIGAALLGLKGAPDLALIALIFSATGGGFLVWNWTPARIFLGDVGSGFLGYMFGTLAVASEARGALPALVWMLLVGVFAFDATVTVVRRIARRERWYAAHRTHAYQRLVQAGKGHAWVSTAVVLVNLALGLLAFFGALVSAMLLPSVAVGIAILTVLYLRVERVRPM